MKDTTAKAEAHGDRLSTVQMDVGDEESVKRGVADAVTAVGGLHTSVNAAVIRFNCRERRNVRETGTAVRVDGGTHM